MTITENQTGKRLLRKPQSGAGKNAVTMAKPPPSGKETKETVNKAKKVSKEKNVVTTGKRTIEKVNEMNEYEGLEGVKVKLEQMDMAEREGNDKDSVSPPKKTKSDQVIIIDQDEDEKMEERNIGGERKNDNQSKESTPTSTEKIGTTVTPNKDDRTSRKIDFLAEEEDDEEADERLSKVIDRWNEEEQKREEYEREAVAFWNQTDPDFIGLENGKWYDLVNNDEVPLEQPNDAYIKTFNKSRKVPEEEGWTTVKPKEQKEGKKKKKVPKEKPPSTKKSERRKIQSSLGFNKPVQGSKKASVNQQTKKTISFAKGTKLPNDAETTNRVNKKGAIDGNEQDDQPQQRNITDTFPTMANKTFAEATKDPTGFNRITRKYQRRFNIAFTVNTKITDQNDGEGQEQALRKALETCLREGQKIDMSFGIMPWKMDKPYPTIFKPMDAYKLNYDRLIQYLRAPMQGYGLKTVTKGRNYKWRFNATFNDPDETLFEEKWNRIKANTVHIKDFPTQTEQAWAVGFTMGSTEKQDLRKINEELENITKVKGTTCSYQYLYHRNVTPALWRQASQQADLGGGAIDLKKKHRWAPAAAQFFVPNREDVVKVRKILYDKYGKNVTDEHGNKDAYPTWPGGAQMKFVPHAENNMSDSNKEKIGKRLQVHTMMKGGAITFKTDIKDPNMEMDCLKGKSLGEAILGIMTKDKKNPVFRHFQKDWTIDIHDNRYSLVSHTAFEKDAAHCIETLKNLLVDEYGEAILDGFHERTRGLNNPYSTYGSSTADTFIFEEDEKDDKWMNNSIPCTVTNMAMLDETKQKGQDGPSSIHSGESIFTNLDKSAAFSTGSDRSEDISIPSQSSVTVPSLTSSRHTEDTGIARKESDDHQTDMELDQGTEITTIEDQEGTLTQNSSISGLTGPSTTQNNEDLFQRMAQSKSVKEMLKSGILTEEQIQQIALEMTIKGTGTAEAERPGQES